MVAEEICMIKKNREEHDRALSIFPFGFWGKFKISAHLVCGGGWGRTIKLFGLNDRVLFWVVFRDKLEFEQKIPRLLV